MTAVDEGERRTFEKDDGEESSDINPGPPETGTGHAFGRERVGHRARDNDADEHHQPGDPMTLALRLAGVLGDLLHFALVVIEIVHLPFLLEKEAGAGGVCSIEKSWI